MDKRYQIFVSSTYVDLKEERQRVLQSLMEMDCIPAGMELFPAADEEQWQFIKRVIDDCDYYLLIIGGRYGSITPEGISYTEKEFDYAVGKGLRVVALLHGEPDNIPFGKSERDPVLREKLISFKEKVTNGRLVKFWKNAEELPGLVALSLTKTIKLYPAVGWVRASNAASENILSEINDLRKLNAEQREKIIELENKVSSKPLIDDIADMGALFTVRGFWHVRRSGYAERRFDFKCDISWRDIFALVAPYLVQHPTDKSVMHYLAKLLKVRQTGNEGDDLVTIEDQDFKTIGIQLRAYGLVSIRYLQTTGGSMALFWSLTPHGEQLMIEMRVVRKGI